MGFLLGVRDNGSSLTPDKFRCLVPSEEKLGLKFRAMDVESFDFLSCVYPIYSPSPSVSKTFDVRALFEIKRLVVVRVVVALVVVVMIDN